MVEYEDGTLRHEYVYLNGQLLSTFLQPGGSVRIHFSDHLGTPRVVAWHGGTVAARHDYYPFGGEHTAWSDGETHKFTGQERDSETGLDYFIARHYASNLGRFLQVDPSSKSIDKTNPQTWNRYEFSWNNPIRFRDLNGKWPTPTHKGIINRALPGLSQQQRNVLIRTSRRVDGLRGQTRARVHDHAMRAPGENAAAAREAIQNHVEGRQNAARNAQGETPAGVADIVDEALEAFGEALHTVTDRTSPAHTDAQGNPME